MVGLEPTEDVTRLHSSEFYAPEDWVIRDTQILPAVRRDGRWKGEFRLRNFRTGALIPVQHDLFLLPGVDGTPAVIGAVSQDISELKRQEQEARQRADFEQYLAGIVGHDLRNPINAISLSAALVLRRRELDERLREVMGRILSAAERVIHVMKHTTRM